MSGSNEFLQIPYEERQLILVVKNEDEKIEKIKKLQRDKEFGKKLLSGLSVAQALAFVAPGGFLVKSALSVAASIIKNQALNSTKKSTNKREGIFYIATMKEVEAVKFPTVRPVNEKVYAVNPAALDIYYEAPGFHKAVADHKFAEAINLLQSLGATKIEAINLEDKGNSAGGNVSFNLFGKGDLSSQNNLSSKKVFNATYKPKHEPTLPAELNWFHIEKQWQNIADGRLNRGLESFELELEINSDFGVDADLMVKVDKALNLGLKAEYSDFKKTYLRIYGEFNPI
ncbi:hypothetical protein B14911_03449 [Bacillus sp. NRRL B-14911]|uniref:Uncharacterized protein n=1 Tax=Bacillus infantis NRRL B-14911 TaxID=1367477 RepID=U5LIK9_9BACI|nr:MULTISPECIES: hypothetical protein [Bacillus]AGX06467.1 hypothetical protein N288_23140 [Bacillus infantis NRRL B-14911]EAR68606.1 hypothetical protein B14911_03449 [Bacillus sp. NRRL B-14911]